MARRRRAQLASPHCRPVAYILATFFNAVDYAAERYDLDDDPVYHEASRQLAA
jgi:hypothetical protein